MVMTTKNAGPAGPPQDKKPKPENERSTHLRQRQAEVVAVLAEALLEKLLRERRARREAAARGAQGGASV